MTGQPSVNPQQHSRLEALLHDPATPRWLKELNQFLPIKSQFLLYGNIRDEHPFLVRAAPAGSGEQSSYAICSTHQLIVDYLSLKGFRHFFAVNPLHGISILTPSTVDDEEAEKTVAWLNKSVSLKKRVVGELSFQKTPRGDQWMAQTTSFGESVDFAETIVHNTAEPCAVLFDYLMGQTEQGQTGEKDAFIRALILSYEAKPLADYYNTVFWLCDRENDLPAWFGLNNPKLRSLGIPRPDGRTRALVGGSLLERTPGTGFAELSPGTRRNIVDDFSTQTDGLLMSDLQAIARFIPTQGLKVDEVAEAARRYKLGVTEDPWRRIGEDKDILKKAEALIRNRVKGQDQAIRKSLDIIQRAIVGLAGAQVSRRSGKPKGVLFLAGPTGVGKTELAKSLTESLFGDENAYIRFDMSEFNHEHADQRLIGAPPGYMGFEAGGELTGAIRERPFSVVLFDEIEKAHPRIMDKFLQILDDGQLTSGKGERVYFSDAIIVFTSNLGMDRATLSDSYEVLTRKLHDGIVEHFTHPQKLGRPELLNRIGDNVVIFDYIRPDVAVQILGKMLRSVIDRVKQTHQISLTLSGFPAQADPEPGTAFAALVQHCTADLSHGGRGVGNLLETALINPLSGALWDVNLTSGRTIAIRNIHFDSGRATLELG